MLVVVSMHEQNGPELIRKVPCGALHGMCSHSHHGAELFNEHRAGPIAATDWYRYRYLEYLYIAKSQAVTCSTTNSRTLQFGANIRTWSRMLYYFVFVSDGNVSYFKSPQYVCLYMVQIKS